MRPIEDVLKINCDGAYRNETSSGGWGFVIRDRDGPVYSLVFLDNGKIIRLHPPRQGGIKPTLLQAVAHHILTT